MLVGRFLVCAPDGRWRRIRQRAVVSFLERRSPGGRSSAGVPHPPVRKLTKLATESPLLSRFTAAAPPSVAPGTESRTPGLRSSATPAGPLRRCTASARSPSIKPWRGAVNRARHGSASLDRNLSFLATSRIPVPHFVPHFVPHLALALAPAGLPATPGRPVASLGLVVRPLVTLFPQYPSHTPTLCPMQFLLPHRKTGCSIAPKRDQQIASRLCLDRRDVARRDNLRSPSRGVASD
jgi:hypothetical protein